MCGVRLMVMLTVHMSMCHEPVEMYVCTACKHVYIRACKHVYIRACKHVYICTCESESVMLVALHTYMMFCALQRCTP